MSARKKVKEIGERKTIGVKTGSGSEKGNLLVKKNENPACGCREAEAVGAKTSRLRRQ